MLSLMFTNVKLGHTTTLSKTTLIILCFRPSCCVYFSTSQLSHAAQTIELYLYLVILIWVLFNISQLTLVEEISTFTLYVLFYTSFLLCIFKYQPAISCYVDCQMIPKSGDFSTTLLTLVTKEWTFILHFVFFRLSWVNFYTITNLLQLSIYTYETFSTSNLF